MSRSPSHTSSANLSRYCGFILDAVVDVRSSITAAKHCCRLVKQATNGKCLNTLSPNQPMLTENWSSKGPDRSAEPRSGIVYVTGVVIRDYFPLFADKNLFLMKGVFFLIHLSRA